MPVTPQRVPVNTVGKYATVKHSRWERLTLALAVNKLTAS